MKRAFSTKKSKITGIFVRANLRRDYEDWSKKCNRTIAVGPIRLIKSIHTQTLTINCTQIGQFFVGEKIFKITNFIKKVQT